MTRDLAPHRTRGMLQAVALGVNHLQQVHAPGAQLPELAGSLIRQLLYLELRTLGAQRQQLSIDVVGLFQPANAFGEVPYPTGIDHHHRHSGSTQSGDHQRLVPTGGFHHHPRAVQRLEPLDQAAHCPFIVGLREKLTARPHRDVQPFFRNIYSHVNFPTAHLPLHTCRPNSALRNATWLGAGSCDCSNFRSASIQARRFQLLTWPRVPRSVALGSTLSSTFRDTRVLDRRFAAKRPDKFCIATGHCGVEKSPSINPPVPNYARINAVCTEQPWQGRGFIMTACGVSISPFSGIPYSELVQLAREAEEARFSGVYVPEASNDALMCSYAIARDTRRIQIGTWIVNIYLREPTLCAAATEMVQDAADGRFILGLGVSHRPALEARGIEMGNARVRLRRDTEIIRKTLAGETMMFGMKFRQPKKLVPIYYAALALETARLGGELADGLMLYLCTPERTRRSAEVAHEEARKHGRKPSAVTITVGLPV